MRCNDARRDMFAFLDGAVSVERNLEVLQHLNLCASCSRRFEAERRFEEGMGAVLRDEPVPPTLPGRLAAALDRAESDLAGGSPEDRAPLPGPGRRRFLRVAALAAAASLLGVLVVDYTCAGPFQCAIIRAAVEVAERVDRGETPACVLSGDLEEIRDLLARSGKGSFRPPDLSAAGYAPVGAAGAVPADALGCRGAVCEYRSRYARVSLVDLPVGDHDPKSWNRVERDGRTWWSAEHGGYRVLGWRDGDRFLAVVTPSRTADLLPVAAAARGGGPGR